MLRGLVYRLVSTCVLCKAYKQPARDVAVKARPMPVPSSAGDHVAMDVFRMLRVRSEGIHYDGFILAVDVLSSYTVPFPVTMSVRLSLPFDLRGGSLLAF